MRATLATGVVQGGTFVSAGTFNIELFAQYLVWGFSFLLCQSPRANITRRSRFDVRQTCQRIRKKFDLRLGPFWKFLFARYLFANRNGNPYSVGKVTEYGLWPVQDKLGIPHTGTHAFRHAAASELLEEGAPLTVVQRQLRHGDAKTTLQKYGHVVGDSQRRAINSLAEKIERSAIDLESSAELESSRT